MYAIRSYYASVRYAQESRLVRLGEVIDVAPVARHLLFDGLGFQQAPDDRMPTTARFAEDEQIEPRALDLDGKPDRVNT